MPVKATDCPPTEICVIAMVPRAADQAFTAGLGHIGRWQVVQSAPASSQEVGFEVHISRSGNGR